MLRNSKTRTLFFLISDIIWISFAVWISFLLRFEGSIPEQFLPALRQTVIVSLLFYIPIFYFFGLYSFSWSYVSTKELTSLIISATVSLFFIGTAIYLSGTYRFFFGFPRSVLFVSYFLVILLTGGVRVAKRIYLQSISREEGEETLIVGAGDAGEQVLRSIQSSKNSPYHPIGFVDDGKIKQKISIHGLKVLGKIEDIPSLVKEDMTVIIALPAAGEGAIKRAVESARRGGIKKIKILPSLSEIVNDQISISDIRDFKMEDLLERPPILYNKESIRQFLEGKTVLVTGAAGSIGSELSRQIIKFNPLKLILLDQDETGIFNLSKEIKEAIPVVANIQNQEKMQNVFERLRPNIVFHAAAYKHVSLMESDSDEAVKNNIFGTKNLAELATRYEVEKFVFISTDKAVNPESVMGATKRIGEMICQSYQGPSKFMSVRFGNVLGSRGSVIPIFIDQIKKGGSIEVTHEDMNRYFMIIPEAVSLVLEAGQMGEGGETFVLNMGDPIKILDLAKSVIKLSGLEPDKDIPIVFTGPKPGEKFTEELLTEKEESFATKNQNILITKAFLVEREKLENSLKLLEKPVAENDKETIKIILKRLTA